MFENRLLRVYISLILIQIISIFTLLGVRRDLLFTHIFVIAMGWIIVVLMMKFKFNWWWQNYLPFFIFCLVLLYLTILIATPIRGAKRWLEIGQFSLQTSEVAKPFFLLFVAKIISKKNLHLFTRLLIVFLVVFLTILPIILSPDLGTTILFLASALSIILVLGIDKKLILILIVASMIFIPVFYTYGLKDYQRERLVSFLDPDYDSRGSNYNLKQSLIAIGSGGLFGKGLGLGTQSNYAFLPEKHTDFIFAALIEQFGAIIGFGLISLYVFLVYELVHYLLSATNEKKLFGVGVLTLIIMSVIVNIGMNIGLVPVTGITLPLVSYGNSAIIGFMLIFGILFG